MYVRLFCFVLLIVNGRFSHGFMLAERFNVSIQMIDTVFPPYTFNLENEEIIYFFCQCKNFWKKQFSIERCLLDFRITYLERGSKLPVLSQVPSVLTACLLGKKIETPDCNFLNSITAVVIIQTQACWPW